VRKRDAKLKYMLEYALEASKPEIAKILADYGVPLVQCSRCLIQGNLPSHGAYIEIPSSVYAPNPQKATPDQIVTKERVNNWLAEGADLTQELANAVLAADIERIKFLVKEKGADVNAPDSDGMTPLLHAAMRNHVPTIKALLARKADIEKAGPQGYPPLALAIAEAKYDAAVALLDSGANVNEPVGPDALTPLMVTASMVSPGEGAVFLPGSIRPIDIAGDLIKRGADVNARSKEGVTALMLAAARNSAPMVGLLGQSGAKLDIKSEAGQTAADVAAQNGSDAAAKALRLIEKSPTLN
jgi:ankyrin repeat protein